MLIIIMTFSNNINGINDIKQLSHKPDGLLVYRPIDPPNHPDLKEAFKLLLHRQLLSHLIFKNAESGYACRSQVLHLNIVCN